MPAPSIQTIQGQNGLPAVVLQSHTSRAMLYLHGGHLCSFEHACHGELLFLSDASFFRSDKAIRGGIPVIFPWFGAREGHSAHGYARVTSWDLLDSSIDEHGAATVVLRLPNPDQLEVIATITLSDSLSYSLTITNLAPYPQAFDACLHTYFAVSDVRAIEVSGLAGVPYHDFVHHQDRTEGPEAIKINGETDRLYQGSPETLSLRDPGLNRIVTIQNDHAVSTVMWNPWREKSSGMADLSENDFLRMICIESGNVKDRQWTLAPQESRTMTTCYSCDTLTTPALTAEA